MKRAVLFSMVIISLLVCSKVKALDDDVFYTNSNGVSLTEREYDFVQQFYSEDYPEIMTQNDYNDIARLDVNNREVNVEVYEEEDAPFVPFGTYYETSAKKIAISSACMTNLCSIAIRLTWKGNPNVRSYDVIGARLVNTSLYNGGGYYTSMSSSAGIEYGSNYKITSNGIGCSMKLPSGATGISLYQTFDVVPGGTIFASYQHAVRTSTLAKSRDYTFNGVGYGNVFLYSDSVAPYYDGMGGVNIYAN